MSTADSLTLWESRIENRKHSGLKVKVWCKQNNVTTHMYYYWNRKLNVSKKSHNDIFAEVLPDTAKIVAAEKTVSTELVIAWNSFSITVTNQQAVPMAADLLRRLEKQC